MSKFAEDIAEDARRLVETGLGQVFWLKKTMTASAILASSATDLTQVSTGGELGLEDVVVKTDTTGLAAALLTTFRIICTNAKGTIAVFADLVSNLTSSRVSDFTTAVGRSTISKTNDAPNCKTVLESGAKLQVQTLANPCTGSGTIDIYFKFVRLSTDANILPA